MESLTEELIRRLEIRKEQLVEQAGGARTGYKIHSGHHMRDIITTLAVLKGEPAAEKLVANMPKEGD